MGKHRQDVAFLGILTDRALGPDLTILRIAAGFIVTGAAVLLVQPPMANALWWCRSTDGRMVWTDSPGQFLSCQGVGSSSPQPERVDPPPLGAMPQPLREPEDGAPQKVDDALHPARTVPIQRLGPLLIVEVRLNHERPTKLILDTGASQTVLSSRVAFELGLLSLPPVSLVTMQTAGGPVQAEIVRVPSVEIGGADLRDTLAAVHDVPDMPAGIEGLLGQSLLHHFEVTVNAAKGEVRLRRLP
jgi:clan AA aspartic protease (TIGR02281 family)